MSPSPDGGAHHGVSGRILASVGANRVLGGISWLTVDAPGWAPARPGQFALLQAEPSRCFLGRAFSVSRQEGTSVSFLIAAVGEGTRELQSLAPGDLLWVLGPLGRGFPLVEMAQNGGRIVLVGGGVGVAPFPLLLDELARRRDPASEADVAAATTEAAPDALVLLGFRTAEQAEAASPVIEAGALAETLGVRVRISIATEDGSVGQRGRVTDLLAVELRPGDRVAVCGPDAMSRAVWDLCSAQRVPAWFSLETTMACGVGSCHGCVIALSDGSLARVCAEGPVFGGEVVWGLPTHAPAEAGEERA